MMAWGYRFIGGAIEEAGCAARKEAERRLHARVRHQRAAPVGGQRKRGRCPGLLTAFAGWMPLRGMPRRILRLSPMVLWRARSGRGPPCEERTAWQLGSPRKAKMRSLRILKNTASDRIPTAATISWGKGLRIRRMPLRRSMGLSTHLQERNRCLFSNQRIVKIQTMHAWITPSVPPAVVLTGSHHRIPNW